MKPDIVFQYFPSLTNRQREQIILLRELFGFWNEKINVISRKDTDNFYTRHVLHSLSIARLTNFITGTRIIDVGTGGGFPGIPLAIMFPQAHFTLLDSIGKKIKVAEDIARKLELTNVSPVKKRFEDETGKYHFIVSRAVMEFQKYLVPAYSIISKDQKDNHLANGLILLKGGELDEELGVHRNKCRVTKISEFFEEPFFDTKKIIYYPII